MEKGISIKKVLLTSLSFLLAGFMGLSGGYFSLKEAMKSSSFKKLLFSSYPVEAKASSNPQIESKSSLKDSFSFKNKMKNNLTLNLAENAVHPRNESPQRLKDSRVFGNENMKNRNIENGTNNRLESSTNERKGEVFLLPTSEVSLLLEPFIYDASEERRDPFASYKITQKFETELGKTKPLLQYPLDQFSLKGILWDVKDPRAMFLDPKNNTHFVKPNDRIGRNNGYVAAIREGEVLVVEYFYDKGEQIPKIQTLSLTSEERKSEKRWMN